MAYDPVFEAQEDIQIVNECIDRLNERSRVSMSLCAAALHEARRQMIARDSEYQEAAWRVMSGELKKNPNIAWTTNIADEIVPFESNSKQ